MEHLISVVFFFFLKNILKNLFKFLMSNLNTNCLFSSPFNLTTVNVRPLIMLIKPSILFMAAVMHRTDYLVNVNSWENSGNLIIMPGKKPFNVNRVNKPSLIIPYWSKKPSNVNRVNTPPLIIPHLCRNIDKYSRFDFANRP